MAKKKDKQVKGISWTTVFGILGGIAVFIGLIVGGLDFINYLQEGYKPFLQLGIAVLGAIWLTILYLLLKQRNIYALLWLAVTILFGFAIWNGWQAYNKTLDSKVVVLVAQFDGPEKTYGLHDQLMEELYQATTYYKDTLIIDGKEVITAGQGSQYAREIGRKAKADLVIWAWYRPTENPNITIHVENISLTTQIDILQESETYQPPAKLADLESFEIQKEIGTDTSTLVVLLTGILRHEAGDYHTALERFESILHEDDVSTFIDPSTLYFYIGCSHGHLDEFELAIANYDKAVELNPSNAIVYNNRGIAYKNLGQYDKAFEDYGKSIALDPKYPLPYYNRGNLYDDLNEYTRAIQDFNAAIELDPNYTKAYYNRGNTYRHLKQYERAIQDYDMAIELDPDYSIAYRNRGLAYSDLEKYERAIQDYRKAIELDPEYTLAYNSRGNAYRNLGQYERAIQDYDKAIELDPDYSTAYKNRGYAYQALGKLAEAEADFRKYEELTGKKP